MVLKAGAEEDIKREQPILEKRREWEHGDAGLGKDCARKAKPVFTQPQEVPHECHGPACKNDHWLSHGIVTRDAKTKQIYHREVTPL